MVEHLVANEKVAGSNPVSRSFQKKAQRQSLWAFFVLNPYSRDKFYTYILFSSSTDRYYTGHTGTTLETRLRRHNQGDNPSTKPGIPWTLKFCTSCKTKTQAIKFENLIKRKKSRTYIEWLIHTDENECRE